MLSEILKAADLHMNPFLCKCLCSCFSSLMACDCRAVLHTGGSPAEEPCLWHPDRPSRGRSPVPLPWAPRPGRGKGAAGQGLRPPWVVEATAGLRPPPPAGRLSRSQEAALQTQKERSCSYGCRPGRSVQKVVGGQQVAVT